MLTVPPEGNERRESGKANRPRVLRYSQSVNKGIAISISIKTFELIASKPEVSLRSIGAYAPEGIQHIRFFNH
jgi:hypothetical protein